MSHHEHEHGEDPHGDSHHGDQHNPEYLLKRLLEQVAHLTEDTHDIKRKVHTIMSTLTDFIAAQEAHNQAMSDGIDAMVTSQAGLTGDVAELNRMILELQNSPDRITPEDQARLDAILIKSGDVLTKQTAVKDALAALDELTPPAVPPGGVQGLSARASSAGANPEAERSAQPGSPHQMAQAASAKAPTSQTRPAHTDAEIAAERTRQAEWEKQRHTPAEEEQERKRRSEWGSKPGSR